MVRVGENFRWKKKEILCPLCHEHKDNQEQSFYNCSTIKKNVEIEGNYESIFSETIDTKSVKSICKILKIRTKYMEEKWMNHEEKTVGCHSAQCTLCGFVKISSNFFYILTLMCCRKRRRPLSLILLSKWKLSFIFSDWI